MSFAAVLLSAAPGCMTMKPDAFADASGVIAVVDSREPTTQAESPEPAIPAADSTPAPAPPTVIATGAFAEQAQPGGATGKSAEFDPPAPPNPLPPITGSSKTVGGPLSLDEVLLAVESNYPLLRSIEQERVIAGGRLLSAMGQFDLNLTAGADGQNPGTYENFRSNLGMSQALQTGGLGLFANYRNGYGDFPSYNLGQKTADGGEFRAGVSIPLLRDREIDRSRAGVRQARIDVEIAEPVIDRQRLDFQRAAARIYWAWVAAGQRLRIATDLARLAAERDGQLRAKVEAGPSANIERVDNQQNIALRNGRLVQAQRGFQQATIDLSLFLRDSAGQPMLADAGRLPGFPEIGAFDLKTFDDAVRTALEQRPEPRRLRLQREKIRVDLQLAENQILPTLNAVVSGSQDVGFGKSSSSGPNGLDRSSLNAGVMFQLPVQRSDARGRVTQARAQLSQAELQLRNAEDVVRAEVQDVYSAIERAVEFHKQAKSRVELARTVARAEREQLRLGRSDVLRVTLREQAAFDAEVAEVNARQDYFRAIAELRAVIGANTPGR